MLYLTIDSVILLMIGYTTFASQLAEGDVRIYSRF